MELPYQGGNLDQAAYVPWCQSASFCMSVHFSSDRVYSFTKCFRSVCNTLKISNPDPSGSNLHVAGDNQVRSSPRDTVEEIPTWNLPSSVRREGMKEGGRIHIWVTIHLRDTQRYGEIVAHLF